MTVIGVNAIAPMAAHPALFALCNVTPVGDTNGGVPFALSTPPQRKSVYQKVHIVGRSACRGKGKSFYAVCRLVKGAIMGLG